MATFGNSTLYPASYAWATNDMYLSRFTLSNSGFITKITAGVSTVSTGNYSVRAVVYDSALNLLGYSEIVQVAGRPNAETFWAEFPMNNIPFNAGDIWIGIMAPTGLAIYFATDQGASGAGTFHNYYNVLDPPPASLVGWRGGYDMAWQQSIYAEYTATVPTIWTLTISANAGGTVSPTQATGLAGASTPLITATPDGTHDFAYWRLDGTPFTGDTVNPIQLTINDANAHTLVANFTLKSPTQATLTINSTPITGIPFTIT